MHFVSIRRMANDAQQAMVQSQAVWMLIAAALFGYFGFYMGWAHRYTTQTPPQLLMMVAALMWSLRIGCIAFAVAGLLALVGAPVALLLYAVAGLGTAIVFVAVAVWDLTTPQYYSGVPAFILLIFAAWNGFSSVQGLREYRSLIASKF